MTQSSPTVNSPPSSTRRSLLRVESASVLRWLSVVVVTSIRVCGYKANRSGRGSQRDRSLPVCGQTLATARHSSFFVRHEEGTTQHSGFLGKAEGRSDQQVARWEGGSQYATARGQAAGDIVEVGSARHLSALGEGSRRSIAVGGR